MEVLPDMQISNESIGSGDHLVVTDAEGVEHRALALSSIESAGHNFPVVWVTFDDRQCGRVPWPAESVRIAP
jgi:hypothetical protein